MSEQQLQHYMETTSRYVVWVVRGAWWVIDLDTDEVLVPECPPPWPAPCPN